jgi:hypothetical protein
MVSVVVFFMLSTSVALMIKALGSVYFEVHSGVSAVPAIMGAMPEFVLAWLVMIIVVGKGVTHLCQAFGGEPGNLE